MKIKLPIYINAEKHIRGTLLTPVFSVLLLEVGGFKQVLQHTTEIFRLVMNNAEKYEWVNFLKDKDNYNNLNDPTLPLIIENRVIDRNSIIQHLHLI